MKVYFVGIGGIGISSLAQYYLAKGHQVSGSDLVPSEITKQLQKLGAKIFTGEHKAKNVPKDVEMIIYSPAIQPNNPELQRGQELKIKNRKLKIKSYPQALGSLTKKYFTIALSGTHGKSTTTAMSSLILIKAGLDPTVILGTKLEQFNDSNFREGKSKYLIIEADECFGSFLNYWPQIIILTSIEPDHLDYYKNFDNYLLAFRKFISHLPKEGVLVVNKDNINISKIKNQRLKSKIKIQDYSLKQKEAGKLKKVLKVPGEHNVSNALAALTLARTLKISDKISFQALSQYNGAWRRFQIKHIKLLSSKNTFRRVTLVSDYAHHPTEIKATLQAAREKFGKRKKIWLVYQPHQYQRTYYLFKEFVEVFSNLIKSKIIDKLLITDIYEVSGREDKEIKAKISSQSLINKIKENIKDKNSVIYISNIKNINDYLSKEVKNGEVIIIMGAGDINKVFYRLTKKGTVP